VNLPRIPLVVAAAFLFFAVRASAAESVVQRDDIVGFVGGESMVAASEAGFVEVEALRALPRHPLRFRCLAWEGDTVFEQRRDLNFPPLEAQLEQAGVTVVVAQFGEMESLGGKAKLGEFVGVYEKLIERLAAGGKRRVVLLGPFVPAALSKAERKQHEAVHRAYTLAIEDLAARRGVPYVAAVEVVAAPRRLDEDRAEAGEDRLIRTARALAQRLSGSVLVGTNAEVDARWQSLRPVIAAKNRLWFNYCRPQNWAFLNGDRTAQPSSRDHVDPSKRWFPTEMEQYLPLIAAREREIDALATQLAQP